VTEENHDGSSEEKNGKNNNGKDSHGTYIAEEMANAYLQWRLEVHPSRQPMQTADRKLDLPSIFTYTRNVFF
jgi:hypothetical protein